MITPLFIDSFKFFKSVRPFSTSKITQYKTSVINSNFDKNKKWSNSTDAYVQGRPILCQESIEFIKNNFNLRENSLIVDLASGPGQLTKLLAKSFNNIIAIEPSEEFREKCFKTLNDIKNQQNEKLEFKVMNGLSSEINLPNESVDALLISQSFHWFDNYESLKEISRVLKKGSPLIMIWYDADLNSLNKELIQQYTYIIHDSIYKQYDQPQFKTYKWKNIFNRLLLEQQLNPSCHQELVDLNLNLKKFNFIHRANKDICINRAKSTSVISSLSIEKQNEIISKVEKLLDNNEISSNNKFFDFPYNVELYYTFKK